MANNTKQTQNDLATKEPVRFFLDRFGLTENALGETVGSAIARDSDYSIPGYAADAAGIAPAAEKIYGERTNLFVGVGGSAPQPGLITRTPVRSNSSR